MRPILAVDVDGVLNALNRGELSDGWRDAMAMTFRIRYRPDFGARLMAVAEETGAELIWCTTWQEKANEYIAPLVGLPELPWVDLRGDPAGYKFSQSIDPGLNKAQALIKHANERPFVWFDDDARPRHLAHCRTDHLLIEVDSMTGLTQHHIHRARDWLLRQQYDKAPRIHKREIWQ